MFRAIGGNQWHIHAPFPEHVPQRSQVRLVIPIGTVFIFHLHQENRSPMGNLQRNQARDEHIIVLPHMREISRIAAPQAHAILLKEPCG